MSIQDLKNPFLRSIRQRYDFMQRYEDAETQRSAKDAVPLDRLKTRAIKRIENIRKNTEASTSDSKLPSLDDALLLEVLAWFKEEFFSFIDSPPCKNCLSNTTHHSRSFVGMRQGEKCNVEEFLCSVCNMETEFPRFINPKILLKTRKGRCGEFAGTFTLICRSLGYETRFINDNNDHVWNEVYSNTLCRWVHIDPCEGAFDTPLMYEIGWKKKHNYIIAFSRDDLQDVTWRYTTNHKQTLKARKACSERDLLNLILTLRNSTNVTTERRLILQKRNLEELVQLMIEPTPSINDSCGRKSGSLAWRMTRGEISTVSRIFTVEQDVNTLNYVSSDDHCVWNGNEVGKWSEMFYINQNIFRKVEQDWKVAYLARSEYTNDGHVCWYFKCIEDRCISKVQIEAKVQLFNSGYVKWKVITDGECDRDIELPGGCCELDLNTKILKIQVSFHGGDGENSWQSSQLARQSLKDSNPAITIILYSRSK